MAVIEATTTAPIPSLTTTHVSARFPAPSRAVVALSALVAVLATFASLVGVFSTGGPGEFAFRTVRGETVRMYGHGIYRYETLFQGAISRGNDIVILAVDVPLLVVLAVMYWRGSLRARLLHTGILAFLTYNSANSALGAAYNNVYLVYVALFSASVFALLLTLRSIDLQALASRCSATLPRRGPAFFMFAAGTITALLWLSDIAGQFVRGDVPQHLDSYTTTVTYSLDLAIITPACFLAGFLVLRRAPLGYATVFALLGLIVLLVPGIIASTVSQLAAGVTLSTGEIVGPVAGFVVLGVIAIRLEITLLRNISEVPRARQVES